MRLMVHEKTTAIELRRKGLSYKEILATVPVAKSTLSSWLKDLPLTTEEKDSLKKRKDSNISRGRIKAASANRQNRILREKHQFVEAEKEFEQYKQDDFFLIGIALYWAEGTKRSNRFYFTNSDHEMVSFMLKWGRQYLGFKNEDIFLRLFIHKPYAHENCELFWSEKTTIPLSQFRKTIYKPTGLSIKKRPNYKGCLRVEPVGGVALFRKVQFWQQFMVAHFLEHDTITEQLRL